MDITRFTRSKLEFHCHFRLESGKKTARIEPKIHKNMKIRPGQLNFEHFTQKLHQISAEIFSTQAETSFRLDSGTFRPLFGL